MRTINKFEIVMCALLVMAILQAPDYAEAGRVLDDVMYAGVWCPTIGTTENFDAMARKIFEEKVGRQNKLDVFVFDLLKKHPITDKIGLYFPGEKKLYSSRLLTIVLSRATDTVIKQEVIGYRVEQHFFNVTISLVIADPNTCVVEYSRIVTGELPVRITKKVGLDDGRPMMDNDKKKKYFSKIITKTITSIIDKTANEFETNYSEEPDYYFQVTHIKTKDDAEVLKEYKNDLMQFLHDALILKARNAGIKVRFLPPKSNWDDKIWERFRRYLKAENNCGKYEKDKVINKKIKRLIDNKRYLTVSTIVQKAKKVLAKENAIERYDSYIVHTAAIVVQSEIKRGKLVKKAVLPRKRTKRIAEGNAGISLHQVKGFSKNSDKVSNTYIFLDAAQQSLENLSRSLIQLCKEAMEEL